MPLPPDWSFPQKTAFRFFFAFILLFILSFSTENKVLPDIAAYAGPFFEKLVQWTANHVLNIHRPYTSALISDSTGLYIHTGILTVLSIAAGFLWTWLDRKRRNYEALHYWFLVLVRYYLALQLFSYGFNKVFKWQFYLPEPNTLFSTVGNTYQDLLYWSAIGSSWGYTVFLGLTEVFAAGLLLFRRTLLLGSLLALSVMVNVVMVNFSYDISVKLYSCFLLLLCLILLAPDFKRLTGLFLLQRIDSERKWTPQFPEKRNKLRAAIKALVIILILSDSLAVYLRSGVYNGDHAQKPFLHGAYEVMLFIRNKDTLAPLTTDPCRWKRMFIHKEGYLIREMMNDEMDDHLLEYDTLRHDLLILNHGESVRTRLHYRQVSDSVLELSGYLEQGLVKMGLKKINLNKLPLMQKEFNWTID